MSGARLRSDIWVAAYLRRVAVEGAFGVLRRRGAAEAGAILVWVEQPEGHVALFTPAPADDADVTRRWRRAHAAEWIKADEAEARIARELRFDTDLWIVAVESRGGEHWLDLATDLPR